MPTDKRLIPHPCSFRHRTGFCLVHNALRLLLQPDGKDPLIRYIPGPRLPPVEMGGRLSSHHPTEKPG